MSEEQRRIVKTFVSSSVHGVSIDFRHPAGSACFSIDLDEATQLIAALALAIRTRPPASPNPSTER
jgi:hypothetical protein